MYIRNLILLKTSDFSYSLLEIMLALHSFICPLLTFNIALDIFLDFLGERALVSLRLLILYALRTGPEGMVRLHFHINVTSSCKVEDRGGSTLLAGRSEQTALLPSAAGNPESGISTWATL